MAHDRFVRWKNRRPSDADLRDVLTDYLGGCGAEIEEQAQPESPHPWFFITLPGKPTFPFGRLAEMVGSPRAEAMTECTERWFEVFVADDYVDVITRRGDEFTSVVARGFAALCARFWGGEMEEG